MHIKRPWAGGGDPRRARAAQPTRRSDDRGADHRRVFGALLRAPARAPRPGRGRPRGYAAKRADGRVTDPWGLVRHRQHHSPVCADVRAARSAAREAHLRVPLCRGAAHTRRAGPARGSIAPRCDARREAARALWTWTKLVWREAERVIGRPLDREVDEAEMLAAIDRMYMVPSGRLQAPGERRTAEGTVEYE